MVREGEASQGGGGGWHIFWVGLCVVVVSVRLSNHYAKMKVCDEVEKAEHRKWRKGKGRRRGGRGGAGRREEKEMKGKGERGGKGSCTEEDK